MAECLLPTSTSMITYTFPFFHKDRVGSGWTELEIYQWIRQKWLASSNQTLKCWTSCGNFAFRRHEENLSRNNSEAVLSKQRSVEVVYFGVGIICTPCPLLTLLWYLLALIGPKNLMP